MRTKILLISLLLTTPLLFAQNKMRMVSYFPVPYVAYNDIRVTQFCDIGLLNQCNMIVGPGEPTLNEYALRVFPDLEKSGSHRLNTGTVQIKQGKLNLNSSYVGSRIYSDRVDYGLEAGALGVNGAGEVSFNHPVHINGVPALGSASAESASFLLHLQLFPTRLANDFPACAQPVYWAKLPLGANGNQVVENTVLVCGEGQVVGCGGTKQPTQQNCNTGCGVQTRNEYCGADGTWKYGEWNLCGARPASEVPCIEAGYECGSNATRTVSCVNGMWTASEWNSAKCFNKFGGGKTEPCTQGCGERVSRNSCDGGSGGADWDESACYAPYGADPQPGQPAYECASGCGEFGQLDSCIGGSDTAWNTCFDSYGGGLEERACPESSLTKTQSRSCESTCTGKGACSEWSACDMRILCGTCGTGETSTGAQYEDEPGGCCAPKTPCLQTCAAGEERTTVQYQEDGACCQPMACVEEIGPWTEVDVWAAMPSDTCNNDSNYDYDCRYYQGSEVKSCVDVQIYGYPSAEYKDLPPAEFVYDHCDGDMVNKYFCPGSSNVHCLDVYGTPQYARLTPRTWTGRCDTGHSGQGNFGAAPGEICVFRYSGGVLSMGGLERYCKGINGAAPEGEYLDNGCFMPTQSCQGSQFTSGTTQGYSVYCIQNPIYTQREVSCSKAPARQRRMKCCPGK